MLLILFSLTLLIVTTLTQPCTPGTVLQSTPINGICIIDAAVTDEILLQPALLNGLNAFTITLWFRPLVKIVGGKEHALFRVTSDTSDVTLSTVNGVRLGMYFTADASQSTQISVRYSKLPATNSQQFIQGFTYTDEKWCFIAAGLSYPAGRVFYYAWQPAQPNLQVNPQPVTETTNFHTNLPPTTFLQLMYWGDTYKRFCGEINTITIYPNYVELDYKHNWLHLAILDPTYTIEVLAAYRLEEGSAIQTLYDQKQPAQTTFGYLGASSAVEAATDAVFNAGGWLDIQQGKYAVIPAITFPTGNTVFGVSFWFRTDAIINGDGDSTDLQRDLVIMKRRFQGTTEVFGILFFQSSGTLYGTKLKINGIVFTVAAMVHLKDQWHFMNVVLMYPGAVNGLSRIVYDISMENSLFVAHQATSLTNAFQFSATDTITLGDAANNFNNFLRLSNVRVYNKYTLYLDEDNTDTVILKCPANCQMSLNSLSQQYCLLCSTNWYDDGQCIAACVNGPNAKQIAVLNTCRSCEYRCTSCLTAGTPGCTTCRTGYYLQTTTNVCDISANCLAGEIGNPATGVCQLCGNGTRNGPEECDDGNFVNNDGCTACVIDKVAGIPIYKCNLATPNVCVLRCGDGVLDAAAPAEECDDGNTTNGDGCTSGCLVESTVYSCTAASPSVCTKLCGNGVVAGTEQCDDNNYDNQDGCSSQCVVEIGWYCAPGNPSVCSRLCGNGTKETGEECDDGNTVSGDGCSDCVVDQGWNCDTGVCRKICGNGRRESDDGEECDDSNVISGDGCSSTCKVETDYVCTGGTSTSQDKCRIVPDICGDGIRKSTEECDDGNTTNEDGCSKSCKVEIGYMCLGGSTNSKDQCLPICGDAKRIPLIEGCDDGNTYGGDGCAEMCALEPLYQCNGGSLAGPDRCVPTCGNGTHEPNEQCDDDNQDDGDGCSSSCIIENGYGCLPQTQSHDLCFACIENCAVCVEAGKCKYCYTGFFELEGVCLPGCPHRFRPERGSCVNCPEQCDKCTDKSCIRCSYDHFLAVDGKCYKHCPTGYYDRPNAMLGNQCILCTPPCSRCTATVCFACGNSYYLKDGNCESCGMHAKCEVCDQKGGSCLRCAPGYFRSGQDCLEIPETCGDGLHHPKEICDDGNIDKDDGCDDKCKVEEKWDCVLYDPQGPDVCFRRAPPGISVFRRDAFDDRIYLHFERPLKSGIPFQNMTNLTIPELDKLKMKEREDVNKEGVVIIRDPNANRFIPYSFQAKQIYNQTVEIFITYGLTVQNLPANISFINASQIQDIYNWSINAEPTKRILQADNSTNHTLDIFTIQTVLPYAIFYDDLDRLIAAGVSWFAFIFSLGAVGASFLYVYLIGEGRTRKTIEYLQYVAMLRFVNIKVGLNLQEIFIRLDYFNLTWFFNVFSLISNPVDQFYVQPRFLQYGYNSQFLAEGGGRFITALAVLLTILLIVKLLYHIIKEPTFEYYCEVVLKYFHFQGLIVFVELFFFDLVLSIMIQFGNSDFRQVFGILSFLAAFFTLATIMGIGSVIIRKLVRDPKVIRIKQHYDRFGELFDGLLFITSVTKFHCLIPYIQKLLFTIMLVFVKDCTVQIPLLIIVKLGFYALSANIIPVYYIELFIRDVAFDSSLTILMVTLFAFLDPEIAKSDKTNAGWGVLSIVLVTMGIQILWVRYAYIIIDRMQPPEVPDHEEIREEPKKDGDIHILQQAVEMQQLENDFFGQ